MSADNGVYIAQFPKADGTVEYRVAHAQAIDNVDYGDTEMQDNYRVAYFGSSLSYPSRAAAMLQAAQLLDGLEVCEYGIQFLTFDRPLIQKSQEDAYSWLMSH